jgi:hypothetical protein
LRADPHCVAYYEPFNPQLAELTPANILAVKPGTGVHTIPATNPI